MPSRPPITQLFLAALLCASVGGLNSGWAGPVVPAVVSAQITEGQNHAKFRPLTLIDQATAGELESAGRTEFPSVYFGIVHIPAISPPSGTVVAEINHVTPVRSRMQIDFGRNKDPPG